MTEPLAPMDNSAVMIYTQDAADRDAALDARIAGSAPPEDGLIPYAAGDPVSPFPSPALYPDVHAYPAGLTV